MAKQWTSWRENLMRMGVRSVGIYTSNEDVKIAVHTDTEAMYEAARRYLEGLGLKVL